jgi:hypothetical protein
MATPNYSFEKRKRELAKKAAKEAKRQRKAEKSTTSETLSGGEQPAGDSASEAQPSEDAPAAS